MTVTKCEANEDTKPVIVRGTCSDTSSLVGNFSDTNSVRSEFSDPPTSECGTQTFIETQDPQGSTLALLMDLHQFLVDVCQSLCRFMEALQQGRYLAASVGSSINSVQ